MVDDNDGSIPLTPKEDTNYDGKSLEQNEEINEREFAFRNYVTKTSTYIENLSNNEWERKNNGDGGRIDNVVYVSQDKLKKLAEDYRMLFLGEKSDSLPVNTMVEFLKDARKEKFKVENGVIVYFQSAEENNFRIFHSSLVDKIIPPFE